MNILLCTLGASWGVIPEALSFVRPTLIDLYQHHPERERIVAARTEHALTAPDELWVLTTGGKRATEGLASLLAWCGALAVELVVRVWVAAETDELATEVECRTMRELTYRVSLLATELGSADGVVACLAGGRKTMSADLQRAAEFFGCGALVHIVGSEPLPEQLKRADVDLFQAALAPELAKAVTPIVLGRARRAEFLDVATERTPAVTSERYPIALPQPFRELNDTLRWSAQPSVRGLVDEVDERQREASQILGNYMEALVREEQHENWRTLYRLPPAVIDRLRSETVKRAHLPLLSALPRAELHCHLGGILGVKAQKRVGEAVWDGLSTGEQSIGLERSRELLRRAECGEPWPWNWPDQLGAKRSPEDARLRSAAAAALLQHLSVAELERRLFSDTLPRVALAHSRHEFEAYERPGELCGSAILGHDAAVQAYAEAVVEEASAQRLTYLELRCSPHKYLGGGAVRFVSGFRCALDQARARLAGACEIRMVWTVDRRVGARQAREQIECAVEAARGDGAGFVVGLDLAGDEAIGKADELAPAFASAFDACLPLTIHAGELTEAGAVWHAAYTLHADRVGHGLSLVENEELAARIRDRRICVEVCPTSNR